MMFRGKDCDVLGNLSRCLSAASFELDLGERLFEAFPRVKARQQACDLVASYPGAVFHALGAKAQPEIAEVAQLHDVATRQLFGNDVEQGFYRSDHKRRAQGRPFACPFGKLVHAHSARRLEGGIVLLRRFAVARSAPFDDIEFDGHGQVLFIKGLQESRVELRASRILQAGGGHSVFSFEGQVYSSEKPLSQIRLPWMECS